MKSNNIDLLIKISEQDISYFSNYGSRFILNAIKYVLSRREFRDFNDTEVLITKVLLAPGMKCELMNSDGLSSQRGKLRIAVEFIPDAIEVPPPVNIPEPKNDPSPLDWLR